MKLGQRSLPLLALAVAVAACAAQVTEDPSEGKSIANRSFIYRYESGVEIRGRFEGEAVLHWQGVKGPAAGSNGSSAIKAVEVAPNVWFVSWTEESDLTVSQTLNLDDMRVASFVTWPSPEGRRTSLDKGILEEVAEKP